MNSLFIKALLRTTGFIAWTCFSAWLFVQVEHTEHDFVDEKYQLLRSLYVSMASKYNMTIDDFNNFSNIAHEALSAPDLQWTYSNSFDFVYQTVTTIGYGYITPKTPGGQILCIFVALVGIPITMLALKTIGELIVHGVNKVVKKFERTILKRSEVQQLQTKTAVILFSSLGMLIMIVAIILARRAGWTVTESVYYWFITCTTIGFGDYVIKNFPQSIQMLSNNGSRSHQGQEKNVFDYDETTLIFLSILSLLIGMLGLCLVSSVLNSIMAAIEELNCRPRCPRCFPRQIRDGSSDTKDSYPEQCGTEDNYSSKENEGFQKGNISSISMTEI